MSNGILPPRRISEMVPASQANLTDQLEANQLGNTRSLTLSQVWTLLQAQGVTAVVNFLSDLRALTTRPQVVFVMGTGTTYGGSFRWVAGGTVPDDGGTVIVPPTGPVGFYRRVWTGAVQMGFWPLDTTTDHTAFLQAALAYNTVVDCPPNGALSIRGVTLSYPGQVLRLNGCTITVPAGVSGTAITLGAVDCRVLGPGKVDSSQAGLAYNFLLNADGCVVRDITSIGALCNWRVPNQPQVYPYSHVYVGAPGDTTLLRRILVTGMTFIAGNVGYDSAGMYDSEVSNNWGYNQFSLAFAYNSGGGPLINCVIKDNTAISSGYYGHSMADMFGNYLTNGWNIPLQDLWVTGMIASHCGYGSYYGSHGWPVGSGKMGMDFTTDAIHRSHLTGRFYNNFNGGIEIKSAGAASLVPPNPAFHGIHAKVDAYQAMDYGHGVVVTIGQAGGLASTTYQNNVVDVNTWYEGCRQFTPGLYQYVWSAVKSNGWNYLCTGDNNGAPGKAGTNAPAPIGFKQTNLANGVASGNVIQVLDGTNIFVGMMVTLASGNGYGLPWGNWVTAVNLNTITLNTAVQGTINAGAGLIFGSAATGLLQTAADVSGGNTLALSSVVGIAVGMTIFVGSTQLPDGTTVTGIQRSATPPTVTLSNNITADIPSGTNVTFAQEVYDGNLWWRGFQQTPPTISGTICNGAWVQDLDGLVVTGNAINTGYGAQLYVGLSTDQRLTNVVFQNYNMRGVATGVVIESPQNAGTVVVDFHDCHIHADSDAGGSLAGIVVGYTQTVTVRVYGGRISAPIGSSQGIRSFRGPNQNLTVELHGGAHIAAPNGLYFDDGNAYTIIPEDCYIDSISPIQIGGTGTVTYGGKCTLNCQTNVAGLQFIAGALNTPVVSGSPFRSDLRTAPNTGTAGRPGERMALAMPTSTEWGYICTAGAGGGPFTWQRLTVT